MKKLVGLVLGVCVMMGVMLAWSPEAGALGLCVSGKVSQHKLYITPTPATTTSECYKKKADTTNQYTWAATGKARLYCRWTFDDGNWGHQVVIEDFYAGTTVWLGDVHSLYATPMCNSSTQQTCCTTPDFCWYSHTDTVGGDYNADLGIYPKCLDGDTLYTYTDTAYWGWTILGWSNSHPVSFMRFGDGTE